MKDLLLSSLFTGIFIMGTFILKRRIHPAWYILTFIVLFCGMRVCSLSAIEISEKMYINDDEFSTKTEGDAFHIHIGNNVWLVTNTVHRDSTGLFAYECNLSRSMSGVKLEYVKQWKCPYCYHYWPIGQACGNKDCPSKYK